MEPSELHRKYGDLEDDLLDANERVVRSTGRVYPRRKTRAMGPSRLKHARQCNRCKRNFIPSPRSKNSRCQECSK